MTPGFALVFDVDGTLTPPRQPLQREMAEALGGLRVPFHVAAGSDLGLIEAQFLRPLWEFGVRKSFEAFLNNGATHYHCPFAQRYAIEVVEHFDFRSHLGEEHFNFLVQVLRETLQEPAFRLPADLRVIGEIIVDRGSMLNFAPIGRTVGSLDEEMLRNRQAFTRFDWASGYRRKMLERLRQRLAPLIREKGLRITFGGQTSFDLVIEGKDKSNAVRTLLRLGVQPMAFLGDALFDGGNDAVILDFVARWPGPEPCPVEAIRVEGWKHTIEVLRQRGWLAG